MISLGCAGRLSACLLLTATAASGFAAHLPDDDRLQSPRAVAKPASYAYSTTTGADQRPAPAAQRLSRRPPHAAHQADEVAKVASHQTVVNHGGRRRLEPYQGTHQDGAGRRRAGPRHDRPHVSESQKVERKEPTRRRPEYVDAHTQRLEKQPYEEERSRDLEPAKFSRAGRRRLADDENAGSPSRRETAAARRPKHPDEDGPRGSPSHRVEHKDPVERVPSYEEEDDKGAHQRSSDVVEHLVKARPEEDSHHHHTASEEVSKPSPFKARHVEDQKPSASDGHKKGHHHHHHQPHDEKHEEGGGHKHHSDHHHEKGHKGHKGYKGHHDHEEGEHGHHDKEHHKKHYEEEGGKKHEHHDGDGHYGEHHHEEEGEKGAKYGEGGEHKKGHSTKGEHNVHKKDEYEKKHEFYDEHHEGGDHEKEGHFEEHHEHEKGGHEKGGHHHGEHHEEHHGKKGHHEKGHHEHDHKGHKDHKEHEEHHDHHEEHGKKGGDEEGKKWGYKKSH